MLSCLDDAVEGLSPFRVEFPCFSRNLQNIISRFRLRNADLLFIYLQSQSRSFYSGDTNGFNMQNNSKFALEVEDSPSHSKEAWAADYVKSKLQSLDVERCSLNHFSLLLSAAVLLGSSTQDDVNRKRKNDWLQQHIDFGHVVDNGPNAKVPSKDRDRRKSQGESLRAFQSAKQNTRRTAQ